MLSNQTLFFLPLVLCVIFKHFELKKKTRETIPQVQQNIRSSFLTMKSGFLSCPFLDDPKKIKLFFTTNKKKSFQPNSFDHQLSGWEEYFPLWCTDRNCLQRPSLPPTQSNPVQFLFLKFVILGWQRFLVSYVEELKYVNMYLGQLQWPCLVGVFPKF